MAYPSAAMPGRTVAATLTPIMILVSVAFLMIGLALPVLPLHVHQGLGLSAFVVGIVTGAQFAASLVSRIWAGHYADSRGAKRAIVIGLLGAAVSGLIYLVSLAFTAMPVVSVSILIVGRALLGGAESFIITGAIGWALSQVDAGDTGKVIAWVGTAMFASLALGAPAGTALYSLFGFSAVALATTFLPLAALLVVLPLRAVAPTDKGQPVLARVMGAIWVPGLGLAFSSVGFGVMTAFSALLFVERGWEPVWLPFSVFAAFFILARVVFGHLPDRLGGARVALVCVLIEAAGLALMWAASLPVVALVGAALTGFGYSLVYPGLGMEAVRRAPPESKALAMGAYTAFLDLTLGLASPVLGLIGSGAGLPSVFFVSAVAVLGAGWVSLRLAKSPPAPG